VAKRHNDGLLVNRKDPVSKRSVSVYLDFAPPILAWPAPSIKMVWSFSWGTPCSCSAPRKLATTAAAVLSMSSLKVLTPCPISIDYVNSNFDQRDNLKWRDPMSGGLHAHRSVQCLAGLSCQRELYACFFLQADRISSVKSSGLEAYSRIPQPAHH
jgi:hypothetical protein